MASQAVQLCFQSSPPSRVSSRFFEAFQMPSETMMLGMGICRGAPTQMLVGDCMNGLFHSYLLLAPTLNRTLATEKEYEGHLPLTIFEDNKGTICLSKNPVLHNRSKHINSAPSNFKIPLSKGSFEGARR